jgi:hypothetical protein
VATAAKVPDLGARTGRPSRVDPKTRRALTIGATVAGCLVLVVLSYVASRAQDRPAAVYYDDAWPLIGWKVDRLLDFRRAAYTSFGFVFLERVWLQLSSFSTVHARWPPLLFTLLIAPTFLVSALWMRIRYSAALLGAVLLVTSEELVSMSTHVKQYSLDVLLGILLLTAAKAILDQPASRRRWIVFAGVSVLSMFTSFATAGVVAAGLIAGTVALWREKRVDVKGRAALLVWPALVGVFALAWYALVLRPIIPFSQLNDFWSYGFLDLDGKHSWHLTYLLFQGAFTVPVVFALGTLAVSTIIVARYRPLLALAFGTPIVLAVIGSFARQIPLGAGRTDTWLYPSIVFLFVTALDIVLRTIDARAGSAGRRWVGHGGVVASGAVFAASAVLLVTFVVEDFPGGHDTYGYGIYPYQSEIVAAIPTLEARRRPSDLVIPANTFTFQYPLYAPQDVITKETDSNVAGWYPIPQGVNLLQPLAYRDPGRALLRRIEDPQVEGIWLLDAPSRRSALWPELRPTLVEHGFTRRSTLPTGSAVLEHWTRNATSGR